MSVVIPAYNAGGTIARALMSVARQTVRPLEIIVVDDGSGDDTIARAQACQNELQEIQLHLLTQQRSGAGAARNRALNAAQGDFVAFLDADDEWLSEKIEQSLAHHEGRELHLVAHNGWAISDGRSELVDIASRSRASAADPLHGLYRRGFISTSSVVACRQRIVDVGGFDEGLLTGQDFDLWLKMLVAAGGRFEVFDAALTNYHISRSGITSNTARRLDNTLTIAARYAPVLWRLTGRYLASLWFRVAAVHWEAAVSYSRRGRPIAALFTLMLWPFEFMVLAVEVGRSIRGSRPERTTKLTGSAMTWTLAISAAIAVTYLVQFNNYAGAILNVIGMGQ